MSMFGNRQSFKYVNIKDGKLVIKKESEVTTFDHVTGVLTNIEITDEEYQGDQFKRLSLTLLGDGNESCKLQMRLSSGYGRAVCNALPNANLAAPITFSPFMKEEDGKSKRGMFLSQNGQSLKWKYTKDNPNGLPELITSTFKGKTQYDDTKQVEFYTSLLLNQIKPQLIHPAIAGPAAQIAEPSRAASGEQNEDDLPF